MKLLVCGGRNFNHPDALAKAIAQFPKKPTLIIEGGATGADALARIWGQTNGGHVATVSALWDFYNKAAGYKRNKAMLGLNPDFCLALPGGVGTAMMVDLCQDAGIPVYAPYE